MSKWSKTDEKHFHEYYYTTILDVEINSDYIFMVLDKKVQIGKNIS